MNALLETRGVSKAFGEFHALEDISISVAPDELVSVIGPNGAGKTTLVNLLTGLLEPTAGEVLFRGKSIAGIGPVKLAEQGLARSFQLIAIFPQLTVEETIATALISRQRKRWHLFSRLAADATIRTRAREVARIFGLDRRLDAAAARKAGVKAIVLVEHDMDLVAAYSSRIVALSGGKVLADLPPDRFFADATLVDAVVGRRRAR